MSLIPYGLALVFAGLALRGVDSGNTVDSDAAAHALNGAFLLDYLTDGDWVSPRKYGTTYYSRLPALSLPYHPPVFPIIEAGFYSVLGVHLLSARLAVAVSAFLCFVLLFNLVRATHGSVSVAAAVTTTFFSLRMSRVVAGDVMLEFPAMIFLLGALWCLWKSRDRGMTVLCGIGFALLAGLAVWTKQHAVFIGPMLFLWPILMGRWKLLFRWGHWLAAGLFALSVLLLLGLSGSVNGAGIANEVQIAKAQAVTAHHLRFYLKSVASNLGLAPTLGIAVATCYFLARRLFAKENRPSDIFYVSWALAAFLTILVPYQFAGRYLFLAYPAFVAIGILAIYELARRSQPNRVALSLPVAVSGLVFLRGVMQPPEKTLGPAQAAQHVMSRAGRRVLYSGWHDGAFIFATRCLDPDRNTVVIRGEKLDPKLFSPEELESFAHRFGIDFLVFEQTPQSSPWDEVLDSLPGTFVPEQSVPLISTAKSHNGALRIYRFTNPSPIPENELQIRIKKLGATVNLEL